VKRKEVRLRVNAAEGSGEMELSRIAAKEKMECPGCGLRLSVRVLRFKHRCPSAEEKMQAVRERQRSRAIEAHALRMTQRAGAAPEEVTCDAGDAAPES
jgi:tRNA(Ile2) C34 agmatinyltransferase TiaS